MERAKILVVEDDEDLRGGLKVLLEEFYRIVLAADGFEAIEKAIFEVPDLILMDIKMPELDGFQVCRTLRHDKRTQVVPIILHTALNNTTERILAYQAGADDYILKPFDIQELLVRIDDKLRRFRSIKQADRYMVCGNLTLNLECLSAWLGDAPVDLSPLEFRLACYLIQHKGQLCKPEQILSAVWRTAEKLPIECHIRSMRQELNLFDHSIVSVQGLGYRLQMGQSTESMS